MRYHIMTLFPALVRTVLDESIIGRAQKAGFIEVNTYNFRDYSPDKHHGVDDTPAGGGMGMLLTAPPIYNCWEAIIKSLPEGSKRRTIYMSPKGKLLTHDIAKRLSLYDDLIILCGHYEGVDERVLEETVDEEISIGDYVLTGGELPACILTECTARMVKGVLADDSCFEDESIASGLLEYPQYTRPYDFMGRKIPDILLSGNHGAVDKWRNGQSIEITKKNRPDIYKKYIGRED